MCKKLFPALAGVILVMTIEVSPEQAFPRTRGGDPYKNGSFNINPELFPALAGVILTM